MAAAAELVMGRNDTLDLRYECSSQGAPLNATLDFYPPLSSLNGAGGPVSPTKAGVFSHFQLSEECPQLPDVSVSLRKAAGPPREIPLAPSKKAQVTLI